MNSDDDPTSPLNLAKAVLQIVAAPFVVIGAYASVAMDKARHKREDEEEARRWQSYLNPTAQEALKYASPFPSPEDFSIAYIDQLKENRDPPYEAAKILVMAFYEIYKAELLHEPSNAIHDVLGVDVRMNQYANRDATLKTITDTFNASFDAVIKHLPRSAFEEPQQNSPTIPLSTLVNVRNLAWDMMSPFYRDTETGLFAQLRKAIKDSSNDADPKSFKGSDTEYIQTFLGDTHGLDRIFSMGVPLNIPRRTTFEHCHLLGGSGAGKTTVLTSKFLEHLNDPEKPAVIVIDGKGTWASQLQRFAGLDKERVRVINPQDVIHPVAMNMFELPNVPDDAKPVMQDSITENLAYVFGSRKFELSAKQRTAFLYAAQLIFTVPGATIETLLALMQDPVDGKTGGVPPSSQFRYFIDQLPRISAKFMNELFYHPTEFMETKRQIQNRIYDLLASPAFASIFVQQENKLDMFDILQSGKVLIVDSSPGALGEQAATSLGRYIISMTLSAARTRINTDRKTWRPAYILVDEAQMFVDEDRTQPLLQQAREFNLGVTLAHQKMMDLTPTLRSTVAGNTSTKYVAGVQFDDARDMAKDMGCDAKFIMDRAKSGATTEFALYVRGVTKHAISVTYPLGIVDNTPKMTGREYADLMAHNAAVMSAPPRRAPSAPPTPPPTPPIDDEDEKTW